MLKLPELIQIYDRKSIERRARKKCVVKVFAVQSADALVEAQEVLLQTPEKHLLALLPVQPHGEKRELRLIDAVPLAVEVLPYTYRIKFGQIDRNIEDDWIED